MAKKKLKKGSPKKRKSQKKEINEKTFELNITSELLNLSKSFLWFINQSPIRGLNPRSLYDILNQNTVYCQGLTQEEESDPNTGGYDVVIKHRSPSGFTGRLLFLQYKAGKRAHFCTKEDSHFLGSNKKGDDKPHVIFTFNDAAKKTQHSTLRTLANRPGINPESVLYVFPRITEKSDFERKVGSLLNHSSFVPVLDLDKQGAKRTPPVKINKGKVHKYRTSYDGDTSEVNFIFFPYDHDPYKASKLLAELICVQIERMVTAFRPDGRNDLEEVNKAVRRFIEFNNEVTNGNGYNGNVIIKLVSEYVELLKNSMGEIYNREVPQAPSNYSTIIPEQGLRIKRSDNETLDLENINYQIV